MVGRSSAKLIEKKVERLCSARPAAFLIGLYPAVHELVSFVNDEYKREPGNSEKIFAVLARSISRIYTRIDGGGDIVDCVLKRPTVPDEGEGAYSYAAVTSKMRRIGKHCAEATAKRARTALPEKFRECTWLFSYACGKDLENRWNLLILYNELLADLWGCAKTLSGDEDTGESEV